MGQAYDLDDLDDEWKALLNELEDRLLQVHVQFHKRMSNSLFCYALLICIRIPGQIQQAALTATWWWGCVAGEGVHRCRVP